MIDFIMLFRWITLFMFIGLVIARLVYRRKTKNGPTVDPAYSNVVCTWYAIEILFWSLNLLYQYDVLYVSKYVINYLSWAAHLSGGIIFSIDNLADKIYSILVKRDMI